MHFEPCRRSVLGEVQRTHLFPLRIAYFFNELPHFAEQGLSVFRVGSGPQSLYSCFQLLLDSFELMVCHGGDCIAASCHQKHR